MFIFGLWYKYYIFFRLFYVNFFVNILLILFDFWLFKVKCLVVRIIMLKFVFGFYFLIIFKI